MQLKTVPTGVLEHLLHLGNRLPIPIAETFGSMMLARAIEGVSNLGIFSYLGTSGHYSAHEICTALSLNISIVEPLLCALEGGPYLIKSDGKYSNTALSKRFLVESSPQYIGNFLRYNEQQRMIWMGLEHVARAKDPQQGKRDALREMMEEMKDLVDDSTDDTYNVHHLIRSQRVWRNYMYGLRDIARLSFPELTLLLRFPRGVRRLLDLGGGHGAYSIWMCQRYPQLTSTIYDLEAPAAVGREIVAAAGLSHRISYVTGDLMAVESLGTEEFDVAFCFNLAHHLRPEENRVLLRRVSTALKHRGSLVLWDEFRDEEIKGSQLARLVGVMFLIASGGDTYSFAETRAWMAGAGIQGIRRFRMKSAPGTGLLWGKKG